MQVNSMVDEISDDQHSCDDEEDSVISSSEDDYLDVIHTGTMKR